MIAIACNLFNLFSGATVRDLLVFSLKADPVGWKAEFGVHCDGDGDGAFNLGESGSGNGGANPRQNIHAGGTLQNQVARRELTRGASFRALETGMQRAGVGSTQWTVEGPLLPRCACAAARNWVHPSSMPAASICEKAPCGDHGAIHPEAINNLWSTRYRISFVPDCQWNRQSRSREVVERVCRALPLPGIWRSCGPTHQVLCDLRWTADRVPLLRGRSVASGSAGPVDRLELPRTRTQPLLHRKQHTFRDFSLDPRAQFSVTSAGACGEANRRRLAAAVRISPFAAGKLRGFGAVYRRLLPCCELAPGGLYERSRQTGSRIQSPFVQESCPALPTDKRCNETPASLKNTAAVIRLCGANRNSCWCGGPNWFIGFWFRKR